MKNTQKIYDVIEKDGGIDMEYEYSVLYKAIAVIAFAVTSLLFIVRIL